MLRPSIALVLALAVASAAEPAADADFRNLCSLVAANRLDGARELVAPELARALEGPGGAPIVALAKAFDRPAARVRHGLPYRKTATAQAEIWVLEDGVEPGIDLAVTVIREQHRIVGIFRL